MKNNKTTLKGMTLVEMIIAIAIFAMLGAVLVGIGVVADNTSRATTNLKSKITAQSPYAANHIANYVEYGTDAAGNEVTQDVTLQSEKVMDINVKMIAEGDYTAFVTDAAGDTTVDASGVPMTQKIHYKDPDQNIGVNKYNTKVVIENNLKDSQYNKDLNLKFVDIQPEPTTT